MIRRLPSVLFVLGLLLFQQSHAGEIVIPSDISVHLSAQPATGIQPGEPIVFTLTVVNHGPGTAERVILISSDFYDQIDLGFGEADCQGIVLSVSDGQFFHFNYSWNPTLFDGPLMPGESRVCNITLALTDQAPLVWPFSFAIPDFIVDANAENNSATVVLRRGDIEPLAIPMLSPPVLILLGLGLAVGACSALRNAKGQPVRRLFP